MRADSQTTKPRPTFFLLLKTQYENLGDLIINRECIGLLRTRGTVAVGLAHAPAAFIANLHLAPGEERTARAGFHLELIRSALSGDGDTYYVLLPGGYSGDLRGMQAVKECISTAYFWLLRLCGVKIIRMGASMGPYSPGRARFEKLKSRAMRLIGLRDHISLAYADSIGLAHVRRFPDFAFMLPTRQHTPDRQAPYIVLSFRAEGAQHIDEIATAARRMLDALDPQRRHRIVLSAQVERDEPVCAALKQRLEADRPCETVGAAIGESALFDLYQQAAWVLSNRLHVLLFSASCGAPVWALVHPARNRKIIGLFEDSGMAERLVDLTRQELPAMATPADPGVDIAIFARARSDIVQAIAALP
ncbi:MAG: hypothetical protein ABT11_15880 [Novosphingobium sp. SCN 66-18]|nr:MAG: hypothetical protein ABT11_15880 [Novosphingobium sp. SCN 66-18]